jgi:hypothetical protein
MVEARFGAKRQSISHSRSKATDDGGQAAGARQTAVGRRDGDSDRRAGAISGPQRPKAGQINANSLSFTYVLFFRIQTFQ